MNHFPSHSSQQLLRLLPTSVGSPFSLPATMAENHKLLVKVIASVDSLTPVHLGDWLPAPSKETSFRMNSNQTGNGANREPQSKRCFCQKESTEARVLLLLTGSLIRL